LWEDGTKDKDRSDRQSLHANIHSREEMGHHDPIDMEQQKQKQKTNTISKKSIKTTTKTTTTV
jgi:hypothetical protein